MKTKQFTKKLSLNKDTISNLSVAEQKDINGGKSATWCLDRSIYICIETYSFCFTVCGGPACR